MRKIDIEEDIYYLQQMNYWVDKVKERLSDVKRYGIDLLDEMVIDSLAMNIGQIGEQMNSEKISQYTQQKYMSDSYWSGISKFRNKAYHHYGSRDKKQILDIALNDLDELVDRVNFIISKLKIDLDEKVD